MKLTFLLAAVAALFCLVTSKDSPPKVQVYSRDPATFGQENTLICHVSNFHPPDITIELVRDDEALQDTQQSDLAFKNDWQFHLTKSVPFTPMEGQKYNCKVTHGGVTKVYAWEPNM